MIYIYNAEQAGIFLLQSLFNRTGRIFSEKTIEGVLVSYKANNGILIVSSGSSYKTAIDKNYTGHVTIPESIDGMEVSQIDNKAFFGCSLTGITFPNHYMRINANAFQGCNNLTSITFPDKMSAYIESEAFMDCESLNTLNFLISSTLSNLGSKAFYNCKNLVTIVTNQQNPIKFSDNVFDSEVYSNAILKVPQGYVVTYKLAIGWKKFSNIVEIGSSPKKIKLTANPAGGEIEKGKTVTLSADVTGADIYYTTNNTIPSNTTGTKYKSPIPINESLTLRAKAYKSGYEESDELRTTYTIKPEAKKLSLSASPSGGQVTKGTKVSLTAKSDGSIVSGCDIYYTLDGTYVTKYDYKYTSSGITINSDCTLRAVAYKDGYETSEELIESYYIAKSEVYVTKILIDDEYPIIPLKSNEQISTTILPSNATNKRLSWDSDKPEIAYVNSNGVVTGVSVGMATITCKSTDGSGITETCQVSVDNGELDITMKTENGYSSFPNRLTVEKGYKIAFGAFDDPYDQQVKNCTYYYTLDGTTPSTHSAHYTDIGYEGESNVIINEPCTLKAYACKKGYQDSEVITCQISIVTLGIANTASDIKNKSAYTVLGQKLEKPRKGINIIDGRKVVVK